MAILDLIVIYEIFSHLKHILQFLINYSLEVQYLRLTGILIFLYYFEGKISVQVIMGWGCAIVNVHDFNLGTRLRWVINFILQPPYSSDCAHGTHCKTLGESQNGLGPVT